VHCWVIGSPHSFVMSRSLP